MLSDNEYLRNTPLAAPSQPPSNFIHKMAYRRDTGIDTLIEGVWSCSRENLPLRKSDALKRDRIANLVANLSLQARDDYTLHIPRLPQD